MTELDRRSFLKGTVVTAAGLAAAGSLTACGVSANDGSTGGGDTESGGSELNTVEGKWSFEIAPDPISDDAISETQEADVVVVGAGISGLVSALSCIENGLSVILISASEAAVARGGSNNAIYSKVMAEMGLPRLDPEWFYRKELIANSANINPRLWYKHYNNSEEAMDWLVDKATAAGIKTTLESGAAYEYPDPMWQPAGAHAFYVEDSELEGTIGTGEPHIAEELARLFEAEGGTLLFKTKGEQLVREDDNTGRVSAVIASDIDSDADGAYKKFVGTKAVILATGDFSHDEEMMTRYCPQAVALCDFDTEVNYDQGLWMGGLMPGEGQKMGLWIGAAWQTTQPNVFMLGPIFPADNPYTAHTGLMVDAHGDRFMNEDVLGGLAAATLMRLPDMTAYCIWGTNRAAEGGPWIKGNHIYGTEYTTEEFIESWENAGYTQADTVEEVISELGLPAETIDTVERYNELCAAGTDEDFYKSSKKMIGITEAPFYGATFTSGFLTALGGLRTNTDLQVCGEDDEPILGLFNVGSMIGDFYANVYTFAMEGINYGACCITLPYVLGKDIADGKFD